MVNGHYVAKNLDTYLMPTIAEHRGEIQVEAIEDLPKEDVYGPRGIGELGSVTLAPAIASAIYQAVGKRVSTLPVNPEYLQEQALSLFNKAVTGE